MYKELEIEIEKIEIVGTGALIAEIFNLKVHICTHQKN